MSLTKCRECGEKVSTKAKKCPHCGFPIKRSAEVRGCGGCLLVLVGAVVVFWIISSFSDSSSTRPSSSPDNPPAARTNTRTALPTRSGVHAYEVIPAAPPRPTQLSYSLLDEDTYDAPVKTQVVYHALVSGEISRASLQDALDSLFRKALSTPGLTYHSGRVTHVFIYLYTSEDHYKSGMGQWIAMLSRVGEDGPKEVEIKDEFIAQVGRPPELKLGLSEVRRREIFQQIAMVEDQAAEAAERAYPLDPKQSLREGQVFQLTKETSLMPELEPADADTALRGIRVLPPGTYIKVNLTADKGGNPWYRVVAISPQRRLIGSGWVNSIALMGQGQVNTQAQFNRQRAAETKNAQIGKREIAEKYGLSIDQLSLIIAEGMEKNWPLPER